MQRHELEEKIIQTRSFLCVGLDTDVRKLPASLPQNAEGVFEFNKRIIDATLDHCVAYKLNSAFYESLGAAGWEAMQATFGYIPRSHFTIADAKRADIGNTATLYARAFFETMRADALTVAPYMGEDSIRPFLEYEDKWTIVLGLTSNAGHANFQMLQLESSQADLPLVPNLVKSERSSLLFERVIETVASWGNENNLMFVAGATQASSFSSIRSIVPNHFLLVPGMGAQGGSLADVVHYGKGEHSIGLLVNASRAIAYASSGEDFAEAAGEAARNYAMQMSGMLDTSEAVG